MVMLVGLGREGGILGSILKGGQGDISQLNSLIKKAEAIGKRAAVIYKKQKESEVKLDDIGNKLGIESNKPDIVVDYGQEEIAYFKKLINEMEESGEELGVLTKIQAFKMLLSLFSKMSKNIGDTLIGVEREGQILAAIQEKIIKEEDAGNQHPSKGGGSIKSE